MTGLTAVLLASLSSGFSGVYYEKLVKTSSQPSVVVRNLQLGLFSILFSLLAMATDREDIWRHGLLLGYTWPVLLVISL